MKTERRKGIRLSSEAWKALNRIQGFLQLRTSKRFNFSETILFLARRLDKKLATKSAK